MLFANDIEFYQLSSLFGLMSGVGFTDSFRLWEDAVDPYEKLQYFQLKRTSALPDAQREVPLEVVWRVRPVTKEEFENESTSVCKLGEDLSRSVKPRYGRVSLAPRQLKTVWVELKVGSRECGTFALEINEVHCSRPYRVNGDRCLFGEVV